MVRSATGDREHRSIAPMTTRSHKMLRAANVLVIAVTLLWLVKSPGLEPAASFAAACAALIAHLAAEKTQAKIRIELGNGPPFDETEPAGARGAAIRQLSIAVTNDGNQSLENCICKLVQMKAVDGRDFRNCFLPIGLSTQQQQLQGRPGGVFNLRPGETKFVRVASLDETQTASEIVLAYENLTIPNCVPRGDYVLRIGVYGASRSVEQLFRLLVGADGRLKLRRR